MSKGDDIWCGFVFIYGLCYLVVFIPPRAREHCNSLNLIEYFIVIDMRERERVTNFELRNEMENLSQSYRKPVSFHTNRYRITCKLVDEIYFIFMHSTNDRHAHPFTFTQQTKIKTFYYEMENVRLTLVENSVQIKVPNSVQIEYSIQINLDNSLQIKREHLVYFKSNVLRKRKEDANF